MPAGRRCWWPHFVLTDGWIIYLWTAPDGCLSVGPSFRSVPNSLPKFLLRKLGFPGVPLFHDLCLYPQEERERYRSLAYIIHVVFDGVIDDDQQFANGDNWDTSVSPILQCILSWTIIYEYLMIPILLYYITALALLHQKINITW